MGIFILQFVIPILFAAAVSLWDEEVIADIKKTKNKKAALRELMTWYVAHILGLGIVAVSLVLILGGEALILPKLIPLFGLYGLRLLICVVVVIFGFAAHFWKRANQYTYGIGEIFFGILGAAYVTFTIQSEKLLLSQWAALIGTAYVIARGLNNRSEARAKAASVQ